MGGGRLEPDGGGGKERAQMRAARAQAPRASARCTCRDVTPKTLTRSRRGRTLHTCGQHGSKGGNQDIVVVSNSKEQDDASLATLHTSAHCVSPRAVP